jgi:hypothetical protein
MPLRGRCQGNNFPQTSRIVIPVTGSSEQSRIPRGGIRERMTLNCHPERSPAHFAGRSRRISRHGEPIDNVMSSLRFLLTASAWPTRNDMGQPCLAPNTRRTL